MAKQMDNSVNILQLKRPICNKTHKRTICNKKT